MPFWLSLSLTRRSYTAGGPFVPHVETAVKEAGEERKKEEERKNDPGGRGEGKVVQKGEKKNRRLKGWSEKNRLAGWVRGVPLGACCYISSPLSGTRQKGCRVERN